MNGKIWRCFEFTAVLLSCFSTETIASSPSCGKPDVSACFKDKAMILLVEDTYEGLIQCHLHKCNHTNNNCIISFDRRKEADILNTNGLNLEKHNDTYILYLEEPHFQMEISLWLLTDILHANQTCFPSDWKSERISKEMISCEYNYEYNHYLKGSCSIFHVDFKQMCQNPSIQKLYEETACKGRDTYILNITVLMNSSTCTKCVDPIKPPETTLIAKAPETSADGSIDARSAAKAMANLKSLIDQMGNHSSAKITMGNVTGLLKLISKKEPEEAMFGINVRNDFLILDKDFAVQKLPEKITTTVSIPKEAMERANNSTKNETAFVGVFLFPALSKDEKNTSTLNDEVIAIEMGRNISNLTDKISLHYRNFTKGKANLTCSSWNGEGDRPTWTRDGCLTLESEDTLTCQCNHLTFFAVLMDFPDKTGQVDNISLSDLTSLKYITYTGCGISMLFLGVALFMYFLLSKAKSSKTTKILINLFIALFVLNLTFLCNEPIAALENDVLCKIMAGAMHYAMLSSFSWFAIQAYHLYLQLVKVFNINIPHYMWKICIAGWLPPGVVVIVIFSTGKYGHRTISTDDGHSEKMCWVTDIFVHYIVNIGYYALVFVFTFYIFIVTVHKIMTLKTVNKVKAQKATHAKDIFTILGLCLLLGVTWGIAFFAIGPLRIPSYYIFCILNSFQGFFLFLYYYKRNKPIGEDSSSLRTSQSTQSSTYKSTRKSKL